MVAPEQRHSWNVSSPSRRSDISLIPECVLKTDSVGISYPGSKENIHYYPFRSTVPPIAAAATRLCVSADTCFSLGRIFRHKDTIRRLASHSIQPSTTSSARTNQGKLNPSSFSRSGSTFPCVTSSTKRRAVTPSRRAVSQTDGTFPGHHRLSQGGWTSTTKAVMFRDCIQSMVEPPAVY
jgi:hypothetical protein